MVSASPDEHAREQYASTTAHLAARVSIYAYSTGAGWHPWVHARLPVAAGDRVLEIGAGTGTLWRDPAGRPSSVVLTDACAAMCHALARVGGAEVLQSRAEALPFRNASFAGVIANQYHLDHPTAGLSEMRRVSREQGWVAVATNTARHLTELAHLMADVGVDTPASQAHTRFDADAALHAMREMTDELVVHEYEADLEVPLAEPVLEIHLQRRAAHGEPRSCPPRPTSAADRCRRRLSHPIVRGLARRNDFTLTVRHVLRCATRVPRRTSSVHVGSGVR